MSERSQKLEKAVAEWKQARIEAQENINKETWERLANAESKLAALA